MGLPQKSVYTKMYTKQYTKNVLLIQFVSLIKSCLSLNVLMNIISPLPPRGDSITTFINKLSHCFN